MWKSLKKRFWPSSRSDAAAAGRRSALRENIESLLWAAALALVIRAFIMAPFKIPSGSMRPTLIEGDRILVNKFVSRLPPPLRGNIIVFRFPTDQKRPFIKRLIAVGGDHVEIRDGHPWVNGRALVLPDGMNGAVYYNQGTYGVEGEVIEVPAGHYFVLGDNSAASHDSRFWGFVPEPLLIGKAMVIFWPPGRIRVLR